MPVNKALKHVTSIQSGFTLVELVTVVVILGIIAVVAVPRFFDRGTYDSREFHDQVISTLRYAQKAAIAQRRFVCIVIQGNVVTLTYDATPPSATHTSAACGPALTNPAGAVSAPSGVTVSNASFSFDALGSTAVPQFIAIKNYSPDITVEMGTGYVH